MIKRTFFLLIWSVAPLSAADTSDNTKIEVSVKCFESLQKVDKDFTKLKYFFQGVFEGVGNRADHRQRPSHILNFFREDPNLPEQTMVKDAVYYLQEMTLGSQLSEMDKAFEGELKRENNVRGTWSWFGEYFKENSLKKLGVEIKQSLIKQDQEIRKFAKMGIFFSGNTAIVDFDVAQEYFEKKDQSK